MPNKNHTKNPYIKKHKQKIYLYISISNVHYYILDAYML